MSVLRRLWCYLRYQRHNYGGVIDYRPMWTKVRYVEEPRQQVVPVSITRQCSRCGHKRTRTVLESAMIAKATVRRRSLKGR